MQPYEYKLDNSKGIIEINDKKHQYEKGDVILIEPKEKHRMLEIQEETDYITIRSNINPGNKIIVE